MAKKRRSLNPFGLFRNKNKPPAKNTSSEAKERKPEIDIETIVRMKIEERAASASKSSILAFEKVAAERNKIVELLEAAGAPIDMIRRARQEAEQAAAAYDACKSNPDYDFENRRLKAAQTSLRLAQERAKHYVQRLVEDKMNAMENTIIAATFDEPPQIADFLHRFHPADENEAIVFNQLLIDLSEGAKLSSRYPVLIQLGDPDLLRFFWDTYQGDEGSSMRKSIVESKRCPSDILEKAISDANWEVRWAAALNPELSLDACLKHAPQESHGVVRKALKDRLGKRWSVFSNHDEVVPDLVAYTPTPSLDNMIQSAQARSSESRKGQTKTPISQER